MSEPVPSSEIQTITTSSPAGTQAVGRALADHLIDGDVLVLTGDLGAGKTCLSQGIGAGLGIDDRITSPTFTIASRYEGRLVLNHLDVYRVADLSETLDLDLPELFESGVTVVEWGEQIAPAIPADHLLIRLNYGPPPADDPALGEPALDDPAFDVRELRFEPGSQAWADRLRAANLMDISC